MLRWNILNKKDLSLIDTGIITDYFVMEDYLTLANSTFTLDKRDVVIKERDLFYATDENNKQFYLGVVNGTIKREGFTQVSVKPFLKYFDLKYDTTTTQTDVESYIEEKINQEFVTTADSLIAVTYFNIIKETTTVETIEFDNVSTMSRDFQELFVSFGVVIKAQINFTTMKIDLIVTSNVNDYSLQTEAKDVIDFTVDSDSNQLSNRASINSTFYYLLSNNTISTDANSPLRLEPVVSVILVPNSSTPLEQAKQFLQGNVYNHLIELTFNFRSKLFNVDDLEIGDNFTIYAPNEVYNTILTKREFADSNIIKLSFGIIRVSLTDLLRKGVI